MASFLLFNFHFLVKVIVYVLCFLCCLVPLPHCPEGCVSGCYQPAGGNPICCDPRCLGGCHGSTNGDCYVSSHQQSNISTADPLPLPLPLPLPYPQACREYYNNGVCVDECPRSLIYEAMTLRNNSEAKHIFDHFCVSVCPGTCDLHVTCMCNSHGTFVLLKMAVTCRSLSVYLSVLRVYCPAQVVSVFRRLPTGKVLLANLPHKTLLTFSFCCCTECPGLTVRDQAGITKDNVDSFKGCVVVAGHIWISDQTSTQLQRG